MNISEIKDQAFRVIQMSPELYKQWNDCKLQSEREDMMFEQVYKLAYIKGYVDVTKIFQGD
jgi:hypothetical protein